MTTTPARRSALLLRAIAVFTWPLLAHAQEFHNPSRRPVTFGASGGAFTYVVLGDSTAAGQGGAYEHGIAVSTAVELARNRVVTMTNLAVSGARTRDVLEEQVPTAEHLRPDLVLIAVGANDVIHLTCIRSVRTNIMHIVERLLAANPNIVIVMTGSPDMGAPPRVPRILRPIASFRTKQVNRIFASVAQSTGTAFAPIAVATGPLFRRNRDLFAADHFHPNERGYATWLPTLYRALDEAIAAQTRRH